MLRASSLNFQGNVEGNDIYEGTTDVVVCDGFVGNVALKTSEGLARMLVSFIKEEYKRHVFTRMMALLSFPALLRVRKRLDHRRYNGASLVGLRGVVIKSHGSADAYAFEWALRRAHDAAGNGLLQIQVSFEIGTDVNQAALNVNNRVKQAEARLPQEVRRQGVTVEKGSSSFLQVLAFYAPDGRFDDVYTSNYVTLNVLDQLKRVPGLLDHTPSLGVARGEPVPLLAAAGEFILEGLYGQKKIGRSEDRGFVAPERRETELDLERLERLRRMKKQVN